MRYSDEMKSQMIQKMLSPGGPSARALSFEVGISQNSLSKWAREASTLPGMKKKTRKYSNRKTWSAAEKLRIIAESSRLSDDELGAFLRREGIHEATLAQWNEAATDALSPAPSRKRKQISAEEKRIRELEREVKRKDKALAEASALLILKKKAQMIWGDAGEDTEE